MFAPPTKLSGKERILIEHCTRQAASIPFERLARKNLKPKARESWHGDERVAWGAKRAGPEDQIKGACAPTSAGGPLLRKGSTIQFPGSPGPRGGGVQIDRQKRSVSQSALSEVPF